MENNEGAVGVRVKSEVGVWKVAFRHLMDHKASQLQSGGRLHVFSSSGGILRDPSTLHVPPVKPASLLFWVRRRGRLFETREPMREATSFRTAI